MNTETKCPKCGALNSIKLGEPFIDIWKGQYDILRRPMIRCFNCNTMYWWTQDPVSKKWRGKTNLI